MSPKAKPWEEEWALDNEGDVRRVNRKGAQTSLVFLRAASGTPESQRLASKAPKMARALLGESGTGHHTYHMREEKRSCAQCFHWAPNHDAKCAFAVVLREAGVLE